MARWLLVLSCLVPLTGCVLLGPGANDDDDDEDSEDTGSFSPGGGVVPPGAGTGASPTVTGWSCFEGTSECMCMRYSFSTSDDGRCQYDWACCIHTPASNDCLCSSSTSCAAEVASMPGAQMVETCPPNAADIPEACAAQDENCGYAYLDERGLHGCCDGLVCKVSDQNVRVCLPGTAEELAAEAQCLDDRTDGLTVAGPLTTSEGDLTFAVASAQLVDLGTGGCPIQMLLSLSIASDVVSSALCALRLTAGPATDEQGRLIVHSVSLYAEMLGGACPGFPPSVRGLYMPGGGAITGTLAFAGASCEISSYELCTAGQLVLTLDGMLTGTSITSSDAGNPAVAFEAASVELDGRLCDATPATTACPAQP